MGHPVEPLWMHHSLLPYLLYELLLPPERVFHGVPHHLELPPALAQGQALRHDVEGDQLGLQRPLAVLFGSLDWGSNLSEMLYRILPKPISYSSEHMAYEY